MNSGNSCTKRRVSVGAQMNLVDRNIRHINIKSSSTRVDHPQFDDIFPIEIFIDLPNIEKSLWDLDCFNTDYGELVDFVDRRVAERLGIRMPNGHNSTDIAVWKTTQVKPLLLNRTVWCFTSIPVNYHYKDALLVKKRQGFFTALRFRHHFHVEEIRDFLFHLRKLAKEKDIKLVN